MPLDKEKKRAYNRRYQKEHRKQIRKKHREWMRANKAKLAAAWKRRYHADIEKSRAEKRSAYQRSLARNAVRVRRLKRITAQQLRDADPDYQKKYRAYRATRKEHYREYIKKYMREWRKKHPKKTKQHMRNSYMKNKRLWFEGARRRRILKSSAPGTHRYAEWLELLRNAGNKCHYCSRPLTLKNATRDHLVPLSRGGSDAIENIAPACRRCNCAKGTLAYKEYLAQVVVLHSSIDGTGRQR